MIRWQCARFPENVHRWRVLGIHLGGKDRATGKWVESLVHLASLSHLPGWSGPDSDHAELYVPEVLLRDCTIEDVGDQFGIPSARRWAT